MDLGEISLRNQHLAMKKQGQGSQSPSVPPLQGQVFNKRDEPVPENRTLSPVSSDSDFTSMSEDPSELTSVAEGSLELPPEEVDDKSLDDEAMPPGLGEAVLEDLSSASTSQSPRLRTQSQLHQDQPADSHHTATQLEQEQSPNQVSEPEEASTNPDPTPPTEQDLKPSPEVDTDLVSSHTKEQEQQQSSSTSQEQLFHQPLGTPYIDTTTSQNVTTSQPNVVDHLEPNPNNGASLTSKPHSHDVPPTIKKCLRCICKGIGVVVIILGICCLVASLAITYPVVVPLLENLMFANLTISNITEGFSPFDKIEDAPNVAWYFWNVTNYEDVETGASPPQLQQLGPYVLHQKIRIFDAYFSNDGKEVYRSSAMFGEYEASKSCAACTMDDTITTVNNVYLYYTGLYATESQLLQQYIPNVIRNDLSKIADYLWQNGYASSSAQANDRALQQWAECNVLSSDSIRQLDPSWLYYPEICGWAYYVESLPLQNVTKYAAQYTLYDSAYALLNYKFGDAFAIENLFLLVYPRGMQNKPQKLPKLDISQTLRVVNFVTYLTNYAVKAYWEDEMLGGNGLFMTRPVQEILFGYYDTILEDYYGQQNRLAFVATMNPMSRINDNPSSFIEYGGYTGFKTGKDDAKEMFSMVQQGTNLGIRDYPVNKKVIDWEHGSVQIYGSSGVFFGPGVAQNNEPQIMWMDLLNRHLVLEYVESYKIENLEVSRYHISDSSLEACDEVPIGVISEEGPCLYAQRFQGIFDLTRFKSPYYLSLPHFLRADPEFKYTLGPAGEDMSTNSSWDMTIDIEPFWGVAVSASIMFQTIIGLKRTQILHPNLWLNTSSAKYPDTIWIPVSIIGTEVIANETLIQSLWMGKSVILAVIFLLRHLVPFFAIACILLGFHILWRRSCFTKNKSRENDIMEEKIVVAEVIDPIELQIDQRTLARVVPSFEEMLATLEKLRTTEKPAMVPVAEKTPAPLAVSPGRDRKLSILVEEETKKVERPKSPRGSKAFRDPEVKHIRPSIHASFFIHDHQQQSLLEIRKSRLARRSKGSVPEAFVKRPSQLEVVKPVSTPGFAVEVEPSTARPLGGIEGDQSTPLFEPSKRNQNEGQVEKKAPIGPALLGDITP